MIFSKGVDQIAPDNGNRYRSRNQSDVPNAASSSPIVMCGLRRDNSNASELNLKISRTIRRNFGLIACFGWANRADNVRSPYSNAPPFIDAAKLMSDLTTGTFSSSNSAVRCG